MDYDTTHLLIKHIYLTKHFSINRENLDTYSILVQLGYDNTDRRSQGKYEKDILEKQCEKHNKQPAGTRTPILFGITLDAGEIYLGDIVLSWLTQDIINDELYKGQVLSSMDPLIVRVSILFLFFNPCVRSSCIQASRHA